MTELDTLLSIVNLQTHCKAYQTFIYIHINTLFDIIVKTCPVDTNLDMLSNVSSL